MRERRRAKVEEKIEAKVKAKQRRDEAGTHLRVTVLGSVKTGI